MIDTYELEHHSRLVQHMAESLIPSPIDIYERVRYIRTISSTWIVDLVQHVFSTWMGDTHELEHHSRLVQHTAESWIASPIILTSDLLDFSSMDYCYNANNCFDRSNNWFLHSLFKEYETWNRNFPTNNIELKRQGGEYCSSPFIWDIPKRTSNIGTVC